MNVKEATVVQSSQPELDTDIGHPKLLLVVPFCKLNCEEDSRDHTVEFLTHCVPAGQEAHWASTHSALGRKQAPPFPPHIPRTLLCWVRIAL